MTTVTQLECSTACEGCGVSGVGQGVGCGRPSSRVVISRPSEPRPLVPGVGPVESGASVRSTPSCVDRCTRIPDGETKLYEEGADYPYTRSINLNLSCRSTPRGKISGQKKRTIQRDFRSVSSPNYATQINALSI